MVPYSALQFFGLGALSNAPIAENVSSWDDYTINKSLAIEHGHV